MQHQNKEGAKEGNKEGMIEMRSGSKLHLTVPNPPPLSCLFSCSCLPSIICCSLSSLLIHPSSSSFIHRIVSHQYINSNNNTNQRLCWDHLDSSRPRLGQVGTPKSLGLAFEGTSGKTSSSWTLRKMSKKNDSHKTFNVAVVGLSGSEKDRGCLGSGKSCLCNRFVRPFADDYYTDHISVLSQSDFSGRIVNNDHWLYWGEVSKITEEGIELHFSVIEQTEFVDDACFQAFRSGSDPYVKRCAATKLTSAEKLMYICKNQLGIEKEYEQKYLADGRFNVDGFICVFDVSEIQGRTIEKNLEQTATILNNLMKTKKPIVVATTKHDEASELYIREIERLVNRKEFRGSIPLIETSSHENVNVDLAFVVCAQLHDRAKGRAKLIPYHEAYRFRKEALDYSSDAFISLLTVHVTDYRTVWLTVCKTLSQTPEFLNFVDLFGQDAAQATFKRHVKKLRDDYIARKMQMYIRDLPSIIHELVPDLETSDDANWESVKVRIREHPYFDRYFVINLPHIAMARD